MTSAGADPRRTATDGPADTLLTGGRVVTIARDRPVAEAVAIHGGRISAVGAAADLRRLTGPRTRVVDLGGRMVVPGFQDAHVHPVGAGLDRMRCDLHDLVHDVPAVLARIRTYADGHPDEAWILGGGWYMADYPNGTPSKALLDSVVGDRPAFLPNRDGHGAWVSSRALELAGIDRDTPDPDDGRIERTADGEPQGMLHEGAMDLVERLIPASTHEDDVAALVEAQAHLHSLGITAWQDAIVIDDAEDAAYASLEERGGLTARVVGARWWDRERGIDQLADVLAWRDRGASGRYRRTSVKLMLDGVLESFTAAMLDPYLDADGRPSTRSGFDFIEPGQLAEAVIAIDAAGLQPHFHAIGDSAVRNALDAVEAARRANGPSDTRPHVAHIQVIHPDDIPRFAALGMVANAQPYWACHEDQMDILTIPFLGPERTTWQYPFASLLRAGARLAMGSDWSVTTADPLVEIEVAVERVGDHSRGRHEPFLPGERLQLLEALEAFTLGSAYVNHLDDITGTIEVGKLADLAVIDRDLFAPDAGPIGDARVLLTLVEGAPVFEDGTLDA